MRDRKDHATFDLPGFGPASGPVAAQVHLPSETRRTTLARQRNTAVKQHQLELLDDTDATGLPNWAGA